MIEQVDWYFDYLSPYPYLQLARFSELPTHVKINPRPVLFAALLNHWGHKGPAEIPSKAKQTYRYTKWLADQRGLPFAGPLRHPFNPLALLRLTIATGNSLEVVRTIYAHVWGEGNDGQAEDSLKELAANLDIVDYESLINREPIKKELRANTEEAIARGVFGVPTFFVNDEVFWGDDITPLFIEYLNDPNIFDRPSYSRMNQITAAVHRIPNTK